MAVPLRPPAAHPDRQSWDGVAAPRGPPAADPHPDATGARRWAVPPGPSLTSCGTSWNACRTCQARRWVGAAQRWSGAMC
ncbi:hypothetical protein NDU88_001922 [Pleurodeles waltl]|uniref:Uncharacterized protein n=1 Tax=Pleurodeles waltl TaxID=8319 RepID=A0AAV7NFN2_PLEWA|nr:hypothetical protein NDU88_001922 [Pleurodeles waltl]